MSEQGSLKVTSADFVEAAIITNTTKPSLVSKKFQKNLTVWDLKQRLELITGRNSSTMTVTALNPDGELVCKLTDNQKMIGSYPLDSGVQLLVEDPMYIEADNEENENLDQRYQLSEEQYASRKGTLKDFLMRNKLGKYNPEIISKKEEEARKAEEERKRLEEQDAQVVETVEVGQRCEVTVPNQLPKRGVVMYKGSVKFDSGLWIGVKYDEPFGKNDGSVNGVRYFEAPPNYGAFAKPSHVKVGDYPEITCGLEYDEEF